MSVERVARIGVGINLRVGALVGPADQIWELLGGDSTVICIEYAGHGQGVSSGFGEVFAHGAGLQHAALHAGGMQECVQGVCLDASGDIYDNRGRGFSILERVVVVVQYVAGFGGGRGQRVAGQLVGFA